MVDHLTKEKRSWNMSRIRSKNTKPEILLRSMLHKAGYRFRLNGKVSKRLYKKGVLPGKPDIVLAKYKTVIFVHGCFWHRHEGCPKTRSPKSNIDFWETKFKKNVERDKKNQSALKKLGWRIILIWECEIEDRALLTKLINKYFHQKFYFSDKNQKPMAAEKESNYGPEKTRKRF